jgi:hypothetical protein
VSKIAWTKFTEWEYKRDMYLKNIVKTENTFLCSDVRSSLKQLFVYQGQKKVHLFRPSMSFNYDCSSLGHSRMTEIFH